MNDLFDILEICLNEIENGADLETVLARYPDQSGELRPILKTAVQARNASVPEPSPEAVRRGRSRVMQRAAEMREAKAAPRKRVIPAFQRLAISFSLAALLLMSSTGLLNASASALPGENLYPVKRSWENIRLFLIFDEQARKLLEFEFENERLHEVNELLLEGRGETISFAGIFMQLNGKTYVSGVPVLLPAGMENPAEGVAVVISGRTNSQGIVEVITLDLLTGSVQVPEGKPVEVELESDFGPEGEALYEIEGILDAVSSTTLVIEDITVYLDPPLTEDWQVCIGMLIEVKGYYAPDGRFIAVEVEGKGSCSHQQSNQKAEEESDSSNSNESTNVNENDSDTNANENGNNDNSDVNNNDSGNGNSSNDNGSDHGNDNQDDNDDSNNDSGGSNDNNDSNDNGSNDNSDSGNDTTNDDTTNDDTTNDVVNDNSDSGNDDANNSDDTSNSNDDTNNDTSTDNTNDDTSGGDDNSSNDDSNNDDNSNNDNNNDDNTNG